MNTEDSECLCSAEINLFWLVVAFIEGIHLKCNNDIVNFKIEHNKVTEANQMQVVIVAFTVF